MGIQTRFANVILLAVLVLALGTSIGGANRSIEIRGGPTVQTEGSVQFIGTENEPAREITCDVTFLRTITRSIPKMAGTLFGKITGIRIDRGGTTRSPHCRHGSFIREVHDVVPLSCTHSEAGGGILTYDCSRARAEQWKLIYDSFQGTLPRIEGINYHIQSTQWRWTLLEPFGGTIECLYEGNAYGLIAVETETGTITDARAVKERTGLTRTRGSGLCAARASHEGTFNVEPELSIALKEVRPVARLSALPEDVRIDRGGRVQSIEIENSGGLGAHTLRTRGYLLVGSENWSLQNLGEGNCLAANYLPGNRCIFLVVSQGVERESETLELYFHDGEEAQTKTIPLYQQ